MTERLKQNINIPVWAVGIIVSVGLAYGAFALNNVQSQQDITTKVESIQEEIKQIKKDMAFKVTAQEMQDVKSSLSRVEDKLDRLIERNLK